MSISETTKRVAYEKRQELKSVIDSLQREKNVKQDEITALNARIASLKADMDALKADVSDPVAILGPEVQ